MTSGKMASLPLLVCIHVLVFALLLTVVTLCRKMRQEAKMPRCAASPRAAQSRCHSKPKNCQNFKFFWLKNWDLVSETPSDYLKRHKQYAEKRQEETIFFQERNCFFFCSSSSELTVRRKLLPDFCFQPLPVNNDGWHKPNVAEIATKTVSFCKKKLHWLNELLAQKLVCLTTLSWRRI